MGVKTGVATFSLDIGKCPSWLFERMRKLSLLLTEAIIYEFGPKEFLRRISDPFFFQSLGCVLAFDWNASGLTTTTTAALKEALRGKEKYLSIFIAGGKGKTARKTPEEIKKYSWQFLFNPSPFIYASKMSAKIDSAAVQDGFALYHHTIFFTTDGDWAVIQQGMNPSLRQARRYHWLSEKVKAFDQEPHSGIDSQISLNSVLNLVDRKSQKNKTTIVNLARTQNLSKDLKRLNMIGMSFNWQRLNRIVTKLERKKPKSFASLIYTKGVGPKTIRALSLIAEIIYGAKPSYQDPARYTYAHGGKDGIPYPVDKNVYDQSIFVLERAVRKARLGMLEKEKALRKLQNLDRLKVL